jgi:hypothetical protein
VQEIGPTAPRRWRRTDALAIGATVDPPDSSSQCRPPCKYAARCWNPPPGLKLELKALPLELDHEGLPKDSGVLEIEDIVEIPCRIQRHVIVHGIRGVGSAGSGRRSRHRGSPLRRRSGDPGRGRVEALDSEPALTL